MLSDVLSSVEKSRRISKVVVVSRDDEVFAFCRKYGVEYVDEERARGLNAALRKALGHCLEAKAESALIIPADIPLARPSDLDIVIREGKKALVAIVPSDDADGTNAMLLTPPNVISVAYGPGSFRRHLSRTVAKGIKPKILRIGRLGLDVDDPQDLKRFLRRGTGTRTHGFLAKLDLGKKART